jgi:hypothetical protein
MIHLVHKPWTYPFISNIWVHKIDSIELCGIIFLLFELAHIKVHKSLLQLLVGFDRGNPTRGIIYMSDTQHFIAYQGLGRERHAQESTCQFSWQIFEKKLLVAPLEMHEKKEGFL